MIYELKNQKEIEIALDSKRPITSPFSTYQDHYRWQLVIWKLSISFGYPERYDVYVCADCQEEIHGVGAGDESWDICESCGQVEGATEYVPAAILEQRS